MNHLHLKAFCQTCSDRRKVQRAIDEAKRIRLRLTEIMGPQCLSNLKYRTTSRYFYTPACCRMSGGACRHIAVYERELRFEEQELEKVFAALCNYLEDLEGKAANALRHKAFELLRGIYPKAARVVKP